MTNRWIGGNISLFFDYGSAHFLRGSRRRDRLLTTLIIGIDFEVWRASFLVVRYSTLRGYIPYEEDQNLYLGRAPPK